MKTELPYGLSEMIDNKQDLKLLYKVLNRQLDVTNINSIDEAISVIHQIDYHRTKDLLLKELILDRVNWLCRNEVEIEFNKYFKSYEQ